MKNTELSKLFNKHKEVFKVLGKLKGHKVKLNINKEIIPTGQLQRRIPFHICEKVGEALNELEESEGITEHISDGNQHSGYCPIVAVPKKDDSIWICVDMCLANQAIQ